MSNNAFSHALGSMRLMKGPWKYMQCHVTFDIIPYEVFVEAERYPILASC
jgi:hypothetical protein